MLGHELVAVGTFGDSGSAGFGPSVAWISTDGITWRLRAGSPALAGVIRSATTRASGLVAVGLRDDGTIVTPVTWSSADAVHWTAAVVGNAPGTRPSWT